MATILLIEDNEMNRDMLSRRLRRAGYAVQTAADAKRGLELVSSLIPDLVIIDMRLPDMSGWDVAQVLKSDESTRHVPLLALTAHAMPGDRDRALAAGCDEYDVKPIDLPRLLSKIEALLERSRQPPPEFGAGPTLPAG
jgi:CheY-like chemotaxis protein